MAQRVYLGRIFPRAEAARLYSEGLPASRIAKMLGYKDKMAVYYHLRLMGIPRRPRGGARSMKGILKVNFVRKSGCRTKSGPAPRGVVR